MTGAWQFLAGATHGAGWETCRVGDLVELTNGFPFASDRFGPDGAMPLVRIRDLFLEEFATYVSGPIPNNVVLKDGDIVIGMDGDFELMLWRRGEAALNQRMCLLRPRPGVDARFVAYAMPRHLRVLNDLTYGTTVKHLSSFDILSERILCPRDDQQRAIADFLDTETGRIDAVIRLRIDQLYRLDEREFALLSDVLVPGERRTIRLRFMASIQSGLTVDADRDSGTDAVTRPYLRVANVHADALALDSVTEITVPRSLAERCTLRFGDVLMTEGGDLDKLGRGTMWRNELPGALHQNHVFAVRPDPSVLSPEYLALLTRTQHARSYFERTGSKTTGLASTSGEKILGLPVPSLTVEEQASLVHLANTEIERIRGLRRAVNQQVVLLAERRQAMITAAVTGQIDIPGAAA